MIIRHDIDLLHYIVTSSQFPAVFQVLNHEEDGILVCDGIGVLIQPDWVLTAAHVACEVLPSEDCLMIATVLWDS